MTVEISLIQISTDSTRITTPIWDYEYRNKIEGSINYIRFHEACKVEFSGSKDVTDVKGNAFFKDFEITRGPPGLYTFEYLIKVDEYTIVKSESFSTFVETMVFELESLNEISLLNKIEIGKPFIIQPMIKIKDSNGDPIKNKRVL